MGRTQPSLTIAVDQELRKLDRVAKRLNDEGVERRLKEVKERVREVEGALSDELTDPVEVLLVTLLVVGCDDRLRS
ncbi:MAG: DNA polymerase II [Candidatus Marsarchaeota archaeon]